MNILLFHCGDNLFKPHIQHSLSNGLKELVEKNGFIWMKSLTAITFHKYYVNLTVADRDIISTLIENISGMDVLISTLIRFLKQCLQRADVSTGSEWSDHFLRFID